MFQECGTDGKSESSVQNQAVDRNMMFVRQCNRGCVLHVGVPHVGSRALR